MGAVVIVAVTLEAPLITILEMRMGQVAELTYVLEGVRPEVQQLLMMAIRKSLAAMASIHSLPLFWVTTC
jgi:hypothetical protein